MEIEKKDRGDKVFKIFCEKHRPLKIVKEIQERDTKILEEIFTFCKTIEKCQEIEKRVSAKNSHKEPKVTKKEEKRHEIHPKKWKEKDKKQLYEQVRLHFVRMRRLRLNCIKVTPKVVNKRKEKQKTKKKQSATQKF